MQYINSVLITQFFFILINYGLFDFDFDFIYIFIIKKLNKYTNLKINI